MRPLGEREESLLEAGGGRWVAGAVCFTLGVCLAIAGSTFLVYVIVGHGRGLVGDERLRSVLALAAFVASIAIPVALLTIASTGSDGE